MSRRVPLAVDGSAFIALALSVLLVPAKWIMGFFFATAVHEAAHVCAIRFFKIRIHCISIGLSGVRISTGPIDNWQELICAGAGPLGSLAVVMLINVFPEAAFCGFVQCCFNLLLVPSADGGRVLGTLLRRIAPDSAELILKWTARATYMVGLLAAVGLVICFPRWRMLILLLLVRIVQCRFRKISCKDASLAVQ